MIEGCPGHSLSFGFGRVVGKRELFAALGALSEEALQFAISTVLTHTQLELSPSNVFVMNFPKSVDSREFARALKEWDIRPSHPYNMLVHMDHENKPKGSVTVFFDSRRDAERAVGILSGKMYKGKRLGAIREMFDENTPRIARSPIFK